MSTLPADAGAALDSTPSILPPPRAEWDFRAARAPFASLGARVPTLTVGAGTPRWVADETTGGAIEFDGVVDHLIIPGAEVGPLDVARSGDTVTVAALVRRADTRTGFVAGMWQEDDTDPRRQYGLFLSLPTYGGSQQVNGHVSADGRPSDDLPYSRDYSASARMVPLDDWRVIAFRYDGAQVESFLDGLSDTRPSFEEVGPPLGAGLRYAKNPYEYPRGLNRGAVSDFTVGAVRLTTGMGNHFAGRIARLAVWAEHLSVEAMLVLAREWTPEAHPLVSLDFARPLDEIPPHAGGAHGLHWPVEASGLRADGEASLVPEGLLLPPSTTRTIVDFPWSAWPADAERMRVELELASGPPARAHLDPAARSLRIERSPAAEATLVRSVRVRRPPA